MFIKDGSASMAATAKYPSPTLWSLDLKIKKEQFIFLVRCFSLRLCPVLDCLCRILAKREMGKVWRTRQGMGSQSRSRSEGRLSTFFLSSPTTTGAYFLLVHLPQHFKAKLPLKGGRALSGGKGCYHGIGVYFCYWIELSYRHYRDLQCCVCSLVSRWWLLILFTAITDTFVSNCWT